MAFKYSVAPKKTYTFADLKNGDIFKRGDDIFIKIPNIQRVEGPDETKWVNALNLMKYTYENISTLKEVELYEDVILESGKFQQYHE